MEGRYNRRRKRGGPSGHFVRMGLCLTSQIPEGSESLELPAVPTTAIVDAAIVLAGRCGQRDPQLGAAAAHTIVFR